MKFKWSLLHLQLDLVQLQIQQENAREVWVLHCFILFSQASIHTCSTFLASMPAYLHVLRTPRVVFGSSRFGFTDYGVRFTVKDIGGQGTGFRVLVLGFRV